MVDAAYCHGASPGAIAKGRKLLGSPNISTNARIWLAAVEKGTSRQDIKQLAQVIVDEIEVIRHGRNDFVHAVFAYDEGDGGSFFMTRNPDPNHSGKPVVAVHNLKTKPVANLQVIRNKAAFISHFINYVYERTCGMPGLDPSHPDNPAWVRVPAPPVG